MFQSHSMGWYRFEFTYPPENLNGHQVRPVTKPFETTHQMGVGTGGFIVMSIASCSNTVTLSSVVRFM